MRSTWLADPAGELLTDVRLRVGAGLGTLAQQRTVAVAHPAVIPGCVERRTALTHAPGLMDAAVWQLEVTLLSLTSG